MRKLAVTVGEASKGVAHAQGRTVRCTWEQFVQSMLANVPETNDKSSAGWVCGAEFEHGYRHMKNFVARHLLSFDYDQITPTDLERIRGALRGYAYLAHPSWSSTGERPRYRFWLPLSRPVGDDEFCAISRAVAAKAGIETAARESHVPAQYMFRPAVPPFSGFTSETNKGEWIDADAILGEYSDWTDRTTWPHRAEGDGVHNRGQAEPPTDKPGIVGAFCRAFPVSAAIERFELPYGAGSNAARRTFTRGSRADGCVIYDDDTKFHSHHDTDPARGQHNSFDLVRLHHFGEHDKGVAADTPLAKLPSSRAMVDFCNGLPELAEFFSARGFGSLEGDDWTPPGAPNELPASQQRTEGAAEERGSEREGLPARIVSAASLLTDQENARRIQHRFRDRLLTVGGEFYAWEGTHWQRKDEEGFRACLQLSQIVTKEADSLQEQWVKAAPEGELGEDDMAQLEAWRRFAASCGDLKRLTSCEKILRESLSFDAAKLNRDPDLFVCQSGTINLRTGEMREHRADDFITACAPTSYNPDAAAPRFEQFLKEIFDGCYEKVPFVQRWLGYCLTGHTKEQQMLFHTGLGGNGKGTLIDVVEAALGPNYCQTQQSSLLSLELKGATPELARLLGQRMVTIRETPDGLELHDGLIKTLTGGDTIMGRMLYADHIEFRPTHKLQVFTNYMPMIKGQDYAIWRRILKLHYPWKYGTAAQVEAGEAHRVKDLELPTQLAGEREGILRWLIEGASDWYRYQLAAPPSVIAATTEYRTSQDLIGQFLRERTVKDPEGRVALYGVPESLYIAYQGWMRGAGHHPMGRPRFIATLLQDVPYASSTAWKHGTQTVTGLKGLRLTDQAISD